MTTSPPDNVLIESRNLHKHYPARGGQGMIHAVDGANLSVRKGETLGLVGESGCGKSTLGRLFLRLIEPTAGTILHKGSDLTVLDRRALRQRRRDVQIIFQDPFGSLNPRRTVGAIIAEAYTIHRLGTRSERTRWVAEMLDLVALPRDAARRYPHEFSGGQRQRIGIARALALRPEFVVCDEAVSALDVSVQSQIINLMQDLQQELGLTYLFISHNLAVVRHNLCTDRGDVSRPDCRVDGCRYAVRAAGASLHTRLAIRRPSLHPDQPRHRHVLLGDVPAATGVPKGCRFAPRCRFAEPRCRVIDPPLTTLVDGTAVACLLAADGTLPPPDEGR